MGYFGASQDRGALMSMHAPASQPSQHSATEAAPDAEDAWTRRARPTFLYVMYAILLWSIPMGLLAAVAPASAAAITAAMRAYLAAIPEPLWALFATGYLGYTAAREWGKARGA
jgi:hypothetical protein